MRHGLCPVTQPMTQPVTQPVTSSHQTLLSLGECKQASVYVQTHVKRVKGADARPAPRRACATHGHAQDSARPTRRYCQYDRRDAS